LVFEFRFEFDFIRILVIFKRELKGGFPHDRQRLARIGRVWWPKSDLRKINQKII
jgi:predicted Rdx family selenoprotein